ncbi:hypothetical protein [uncultured Secundilactobacillus sp.]|uniref:hypothetical protein n=1 Tax=uncultured Secundilactobacillus sp. TaxID=2813935 RepID=UPI0025842152|nr:hypothetical protein [uncultured Secundilactobacillus sp.]
MKLNHLLKTLAITAALIGGGLVVNQTTAQAKGFTWLKTKDYSANPPLYTAKTAGQSVTMWNAKHTKKLHNLKNYPTTQWSVTQSVKMYNPKKTWGNKTGIYYKLTTQTGKYYGYVHRNFVKRVNTGTGNSNAQSSNTVAQQNKTILSLFPGTINSADFLKTMESGYDEQFGSQFSRQQIYFLKNNQVSIGPYDVLENPLVQQVLAKKITYKQYILKNLQKQNIDPTKYKGWLIGVSSFDTSKQFIDETTGAGDFTILLMKPEAFQTFKSLS